MLPVCQPTTPLGTNFHSKRITITGLQGTLKAFLRCCQHFNLILALRGNWLWIILNCHILRDSLHFNITINRVRISLRWSNRRLNILIIINPLGKIIWFSKNMMLNFHTWRVKIHKQRSHQQPSSAITLTWPNKHSCKTVQSKIACLKWRPHLCICHRPPSNLKSKEKSIIAWWKTLGIIRDMPKQ